MKGLSAFNFTLPLRAERHGHALQENFSIYNIHQITLGEHEHGKYCGSAPQPAHLVTGPTQLESGQLIWKIPPQN